MKLACDAGSLPSFSDHLAPIWRALPDELKDGFYARGRAAERAKQLGISVNGQGQARSKELVLVASYEDHRRAGNAATILLQHGAGQTYTGDPDAATNPSYSGGEGREAVVLFLCPSEADAEVCRSSGARAVAIGVPKMDDFHNGTRQGPVNERPVVAISFHSDVNVCAETRSAFAHYQAELIRLAKDPNRPFDLLGHGHPRWGEFMAKFWKRVGVPFARHFDEVLEKADCYVVDNSSTGPEFASTGRNIMWLSAPWYRREVEHGGRFWKWSKMAPHVQSPDELVGAINLALANPATIQEWREEMVETVYGSLCDGRATQRAVAAIESLLATR